MRALRGLATAAVGFRRVANSRVSLPPMSRAATPSSRRSTTAWGAAIGLLARRDLSEGEVRGKLLARDFGESEVEEAISRLRERRYLDDGSLAQAVARTQARTKHQGPLKIRAHLRRRQIPEELALEAVRAEFPEGAENERALMARRRLEPSPAGDSATGSAGAEPDGDRRKAAARLFRRLVSRGYSREAARQAVLSGGHALQEERDPDPET